MRAGKGSKQRPTNFKKLRENFPKSKRQIEGFVQRKGAKVTKVYK